MYRRQDERETLWQRDPVGFSEVAHEYLCCDVPTVTACTLCPEKEEACKNKAEIMKAIRACQQLEFIERAKDEGGQ